MTKAQLSEMKRVVKKATGLNMNQIEIESYSANTIGYSFYKTNYDKARGVKTYGEVAR